MEIHRARTAIPWLVTFAALLIYLPFPSHQYDQNGIIEAIGLEAGLPSQFVPNHMLYRPFGAIIYRFLELVGYSGPSIKVLQVLTAVGAASTIGVAFVAFRFISGSSIAALLGAAFFATSWSFWTFSTDAYYITPAVLFVASALACIVPPGMRPARAIWAGLFCALAVLFWQANIFLVPGLMLALNWTQSEQPRRRRLVLGLILGAVAALTTLAVFLTVGTLVLGHLRPESFARWILSYGGARLPLWGQADVKRVIPAAVSAVSSLIPLWEGLGLRALAKAQFAPRDAPGQIALIGLIIFGLLSVRQLLRIRTGAQLVQSWLLWLGVCYLLYMPFLVWWDPFEPKWFVVPNLFLAAGVSYIWRDIHLMKRRGTAVAVCVIALALGTFGATIWPRHANENTLLRQGSCIAQNSDAGDLVLTTDWRWHMYLSYFFERDVFDVIHEAGLADNRAGVLAKLQHTIAETRARGGAVYMADLRQYTAQEALWFTQQTGLTVTDFDPLPKSTAFACDNTRFLQIK